MTLKVHISPRASQTDAAGGVGRVVAALERYLPEHGIALVEPDEAEIIAAHISKQSYDLERVDVLHCHGLYWTGDPSSGEYIATHHRVNSEILETARGARAITVPSAWVAMPFMRDMRLTPEIIGHGIDLEEWAPDGRSDEYILWNKNRAADVCDPTPAVELANRGAPVMTTFVKPRTLVPGNLRITGKLPYEQMRPLVRRAGIYLATTKETFGIGTLEAMAAGVPILGYRHGGTADLVEHGQTGYLVEPGDIDGLYAGYQWLMARRATISQNCILEARRYDWRQIVGQYAALYRRIAEEKRQARSGVSVVITNYNYGRYVEHAIRSAYEQTIRPDEIIVIDDGSTDDSQDVIARVSREIPVIVRAQTNAGVASARNAGVAIATCEHIVCLDADDELAPTFLEATLPALQADRALGIAYTALKLLWPDGRESLSQFPPAFDWSVQSSTGNPPPTCIPSGAMFRREMWQRAGGWEQEWAPGEDTEFWTRGLSVGFRAAKVSDEPLFRYRLHDGSASRTKQYKPIDTWHPWMRDRLYPMAAPAATAPLVRSYSQPSVSVIIPVGPGHARYLPEALRSLVGQTYRNWECIVVDDSGDEPEAIWSTLRAFPFVDVRFTRGKEGAGAARNIGLKVARAPYVLWLDADDYLLPQALERLLETLAANSATARYAYSDWYAVRNGEYVHDQAVEYSQMEWFRKGFHAVSVLMLTEDARGVGGFDAELRGWEDYDFFLKLAASGVCGVRCAEPLLAYRQELGTRREQSLALKKEIAAVLEARYGAFRDGGKAMAGCCGGNGRTIEEAKQYLGLLAPHPLAQQAQPVTVERGIEPPAKVRMEFIGQEVGAITFRGKSGQTYRGGNNGFDRFANVLAGDVDSLESTGKWRQDPRQALQQRAQIPAASPPPALTPEPAPLPQPDPRTLDPLEAEPPTLPATDGGLTPRDLILVDADEESSRAADEAVRQHLAKQRKAERR